MPTIIALCGAPNTGKTTTIGRLYDQLKSDKSYIIFKDRTRPSSHEFYAILKREDKLIGIASYRDSVSVIKHHLDLFQRRDCSIIVIACRTEGDIRNIIKDYPGYDKIYKDRTRTGVIADRDLIDAKYLLGEIERDFR